MYVYMLSAVFVRYINIFTSNHVFTVFIYFTWLSLTSSQGLLLCFCCGKAKTFGNPDAAVCGFI